MSEFDEIAKAIGYHFWKCESDQEAYNCGRDCAIEVVKRLSEFRDKQQPF